jgi:hypothetical protein
MYFQEWYFDASLDILSLDDISERIITVKNVISLIDHLFVSKVRRLLQ